MPPRQRVKKVRDFFARYKRHIFYENKFSRKISLRSSKSLMAQAFLMAIIQLEAGLFSLRLGHGAALTCHRHVIHSRAAASLPLKLPRCAVVFTQQHRFFDSLKQRMLSRASVVSACQKSRWLFCTLQIRHIFCEAYASRKISLRSSKSPDGRF